MIAVLVWPFRATWYAVWLAFTALGHPLAWFVMLAACLWAWSAGHLAEEDLAPALFMALLAVMACRFIAARLPAPARARSRLPKPWKAPKPQRAMVAVAPPSRRASPSERTMRRRLPPHLGVLLD